MNDQPITAIQRDTINRLPRQTFDLAPSPLGEVMVETHDGQFVKRLHYAAMEARARLAEARVVELERENAILWTTVSPDPFDAKQIFERAAKEYDAAE